MAKLAQRPPIGASYSSAGLLKQITDAAGGALSNSATFNYDDLGRLLSVTNSPNMAGAFGYDANGNTTSKEGVSYTYDPGAKPHQPLQVGGVSVPYDYNGNIMGSNGHSYLFGREDRLDSIDGGAVRFVYDYTGNRVAKVVNNSSVTRYYGDLAEGTDGWLTKYYFIGGMRVASQRVANFQIASGPSEPPVMLAQVPGTQPALVLTLRHDVQRGVMLVVAVTTIGLLLWWTRTGSALETRSKMADTHARSWRGHCGSHLRAPSTTSRHAGTSASRFTETRAPGGGSSSGWRGWCRAIGCGCTPLS